MIHQYITISYMGASKNRVPPNHPILIGFSIIFTIHFGVPILLETPTFQQPPFGFENFPGKWWCPGWVLAKILQFRSGDRDPDKLRKVEERNGVSFQFWRGGLVAVWNTININIWFIWFIWDTKKILVWWGIWLWKVQGGVAILSEELSKI